MNCALTPSGKRVGRRHQSGKEICSFSLEKCLRDAAGKSGTGYICPYTLETFDSQQKGTSCCGRLRTLSRNCH